MNAKKIVDITKCLIIFVLAFPVLLPLLTVRKCLLLSVQLLEVLHLVVIRWIYIPLLGALGLLDRLEPSKPDHYHYHGMKDWLTSKLGVGHWDWKRLEDRYKDQVDS